MYDNFYYNVLNIRDILVIFVKYFNYYLIFKKKKFYWYDVCMLCVLVIGIIFICKIMIIIWVLKIYGVGWFKIDFV